MLELKDLDLRTDAKAGRYVKDEIVQVQFAVVVGELMSLEGANRYQNGDALISSASGEQWVVSRERFDAKYIPAEPGLVHGIDGAYRNRPSVVLARRMERSFRIARSDAGDVLQGKAGDWVMQYAPGDYGVTQAQRFARVYRRAD